MDKTFKAENKMVSDWLLNGAARIREQAMLDKLGPASKHPGHDTRWLDLIADVERSLTQEQKVLLEVRRQANNQRGGQPGRPGWLAYAQSRYPLVMAQRTGKSAEAFYISTSNTFYRWWEQLVLNTARIAARRGLLG